MGLTFEGRKRKGGKRGRRKGRERRRGGERVASWPLARPCLQ